MLHTIENVDIVVTMPGGEEVVFNLEAPNGQNPFRFGFRKVPRLPDYRGGGMAWQRGNTAYQFFGLYSYESHEMDLRYLLLAESIELRFPPNFLDKEEYQIADVILGNTAAVKNYLAGFPVWDDEGDVMPGGNLEIEFLGVQPFNENEVAEFKAFQREIPPKGIQSDGTFFTRTGRYKVDFDAGEVTLLYGYQTLRTNQVLALSNGWVIGNGGFDLRDENGDSIRESGSNIGINFSPSWEGQAYARGQTNSATNAFYRDLITDDLLYSVSISFTSVAVHDINLIGDMLVCIGGARLYRYGRNGNQVMPGFTEGFGGSSNVDIICTGDPEIVYSARRNGSTSGRFQKTTVNPDTPGILADTTLSMNMKSNVAYKRDFCRDKDGRILCAGSDGVYIVQDDGSSFSLAGFIPVSGTIANLKTDTFGRIWVHRGTFAKALIFDSEGNLLVEYDSPDTTFDVFPGWNYMNAFKELGLVTPFIDTI